MTISVACRSSRIPASPVKKATQPTTSETIAIHSDSDSDSGSDSDEDVVQQILGGATVPPKPRNKRLSVWSTKNETEVLAISSDSDTEDPSDEADPKSFQRPSSNNVRSRSSPSFQATAPSDAARKKQEHTRPGPSVSKPPAAAKARVPSKKRLRELLVDYAEELYTSLNANVFGHKLPPVKSASEEAPSSCEIIWSNTLKKTAGRAVIARSANHQQYLICLSAEMST